MAKFYVGCRVRIKWSVHFPELIGLVGTITDTCGDGGVDGTSEWLVSPDAWGSDIDPVSGARFGPRGEQLEPASDANEKTTWEECAWYPEHLRETV